MTIDGYKITWRTWLALFAMLALAVPGLAAFGICRVTRRIAEWCEAKIKQTADWGLATNL